MKMPTYLLAFALATGCAVATSNVASDELVAARADYKRAADSPAATVSTKELAAARSEAVPPAPSFPRFGEQVSHMTDHFVLSASSDMYRIWRFQSAYPAVEFPVTEDGWARAWTRFRELESEAA